MKLGTRTLLSLSPVHYNCTWMPEGPNDIACNVEEADELLPELVVHNHDNQAERVRYHILPILLVQLAQSQYALITQQQNTIITLEQQVGKREQMIRSVKQSC